VRPIPTYRILKLWNRNHIHSLILYAQLSEIKESKVMVNRKTLKQPNTHTCAKAGPNFELNLSFFKRGTTSGPVG
jgi:hypothetical protein